MILARDVTANDPGARRQTLTKRSKNLVMAEDSEERLAMPRPFLFKGNYTT